MRNLILVVCSMGLFTSLSMAQGKIDSQWNCGKATAGQSIDVPDQAGHAYAISQFNCTGAKGEIEGLKEKEGTASEFDEVKGSTVTFHGVFVETLSNGDKLHVSYHGMGKTENGQVQSGSNEWSITSGTGKFKGAKGKGTCKGKGNADGTTVYDCSGDYTLAK